MTSPDELSDEQRYALAFAEVIARPGAMALLLNEENHPNGWVPIAQAARGDQAFAVEPADYLIGVDLDEPEDRGWVDDMWAGLAERGCRFVVVSSGREGHLHLWVLLPPGWTYEYAKAAMRDAAGEPRTWLMVRRNAMRPPYAPHRLGGRSAIIEPGPATALKWFRSVRRQGVPDLARAALQWLDPHAVITKRGVIDRGRTIHRAAVALVNARCTENDLLLLLRSEVNAVTSKYHEMPAQRRADFVDSAWRAACEYVREHPPAATNRERIEALQEQVPAMQWTVRTGPQDRSVYRTLLDVGHTAASLEVAASVRRLAELTNLSTSGVQAALRRLSSAGYIERLEGENRLSADACSYRLAASLPAKSSVTPHTWPYYGGPKAMCAEEATFLADIFTNGSGLGVSTRETWEALPTTPTTAKELEAVHPGRLKRATILQHLRRLHDAGFAGKKGHRWWRVHPDLTSLDRLAQLLGVKNKGARKASRYERERKEHREWLGHTPSTPSPST